MSGSLSGLVPNRQTDGQTDRQTDRISSTAKLNLQEKIFLQIRYVLKMKKKKTSVTTWAQIWQLLTFTHLDHVYKAT